MSVGLSLLRALWRAAMAATTVTLLSWTLVECAPGTTAERGAMAARSFAPMDSQTSPEVQASIVADFARRHDLDRSFPRRLAGQVIGIAVLDFGKSWQDEELVVHRVFSSSGLRTLLLCVGALLLALFVGLWGATASARRAGRFTDSLWSFYAALILCVPVPWLALLAIRSFAYGHPFSLAPSGGLHGFGDAILPILILAAAPTAVIWRHAREAMQEQSASNWAVAARARGIEPKRLWRVYILRSVLPTVLALVPPLLAYILAASVVVERVFAIEGLGDLLAWAALAGDAPVLIAAAAMSAAIISLASSAALALVGKIDPRREAAP